MSKDNGEVIFSLYINIVFNEQVLRQDQNKFVAAPVHYIYTYVL